MTINKHQWIDIVKGIGILSIVIGHITDGVLREVFFLFHVPLFFFLSGYLFKQPLNLSGFLIKKSKALLIPYVSFLVVFVSLLLVKGWFKTHEINVGLITDALWGGQSLTGELSVFWFITSLFLTQVVFALICSVTDRKKLFIIMMTSLLLAYISEEFMQSKSFLWAANTVLYTLPLFYAGYLYKGSSSSTTLIVKRFSFVYTALLLAALSIKPELFYIDIKHFMLGVPFVSFLLSLTITIVFFVVAQKIVAFNTLTKLCVLLGSISMTIMYVHQPVQIALKHGFQLHEQLNLILVTILLAVIIHYLLSSTRLSRQYFLGGK